MGGEHETSDEEILNEEEDKKAGHEVHEGQEHGGNKVKYWQIQKIKYSQRKIL